jgi:TRAP-type uncharacterized transport system substrate-binding protein
MSHRAEFPRSEVSSARWRLWSQARSLLPVLAPFLVSVIFVVCYCGPNIPRGISCFVRTHLRLASGPQTRSELGSEGRRIFYPYELGGQISRIVQRNCGNPPRWWSLDFWVNPDAQCRVSIENLPSAGTRDGLTRLFKSEVDPLHVDLAIVQDGLIVDGDLDRLNQAEPDRIQALIPLYRSVFCAFVRKETTYRNFTDLKAHKARIYVGQEGSGTRYLSLRILSQLGIRFEDAHPNWSAGQTARAMTAEGSDGDQIEVALVLDKLDCGVIRSYVESGRFEMLSIDGIDDLLRDDDVFRASTSIRPITLVRGSLSEKNAQPSRRISTLESRTILACSADLSNSEAYQITRIVNEHFRELGLGTEATAAVSQADPGGSFDYPIHEGASRYYRHGRSAETFPYQVLVVAIGASIALTVYWQSLMLKRRADRLIRRIDVLFKPLQLDPERRSYNLHAFKIRAILHYKEGRLNKEGYDRINEYINTFNTIVEHRQVELASDGLASGVRSRHRRTTRGG